MLPPEMENRIVDELRLAGCLEAWIRNLDLTRSQACAAGAMNA